MYKPSYVIEIPEIKASVDAIDREWIDITVGTRTHRLELKVPRVSLQRFSLQIRELMRDELPEFQANRFPNFE